MASACRAWPAASKRCGSNQGRASYLRRLTRLVAHVFERVCFLLLANLVKPDLFGVERKCSEVFRPKFRILHCNN
jgi:hypothetical protein